MPSSSLVSARFRQIGYPKKPLSIGKTRFAVTSVVNMQLFYQDAKFALRMLTNNLSFAAVAILTLALGIGANTAIFSTINAVFLRPLPYREPGQLLAVSAADPGSSGSGIPVSFTKFTLLEQQNQAFESIAAYYSTTLGLSASQETEAVQAARVSLHFFATLGIATARGRGFLAEEEVTGGPDVVMISDGFWHSHFAGDERTLGKSLDLDGKASTIVGILPPDFRFPFAAPEPDVWLPRVDEHALLKPAQIHSGAGYLSIIARLRSGEALSRAQAELDTFDQHYKEQFAGYADAPKYRLKAAGLEESLVGSLRSSFLVLLTAVGLVLLIACANVANLLLARATVRDKELALRKALGASRARLVRQLITESVVLSFIGGVLGLLLAALTMPVVRSLAPGQIPRLTEAKVDTGVLLFCLLLSGATGLVFGLAPALQMAGKRVHEALKEGSRGSSMGSGRGTSRALLVIGEIALALVLMTTAGLFVESFVQLMRVDPGFSARQLTAFPISLPAAHYAQPDRQAQFFRQLLDRIRAAPGIEAAAMVSFLPLSGASRLSYFCPEGHICQGLGKDPLLPFWQISDGYFNAVRTPLVRGRSFTASDSGASLTVAMVSETAARHFWPNQNPIGKHITGSRDRVPREVVGVVGDVKYDALNATDSEQMYLPFEQMPYPAMNLLVRSPFEQAALIPLVRATIAQLDSNLPVANVSSMESILQTSVAQPRLLMELVSIFAGFALLLASVGLYGVMAYSVSARTRELGIRMSLGASRQDIFRLVVGQGTRLSLVGVLIGLVASLALTHLISALLFRVHAADPLAFVVAAASLMLTSVCACYVPARRAVGVDPLVALRYE